VAAILIGDRTGLDHAIVRDLQHAGVYHVVAISGGNVAIWLAVLVCLPRAAGVGVRTGLWWLAIGLLAFAAVVDGGASVARAVSVAAIVLVARWWDVRTSAMHALVAAAGLQWVRDPLAWHDAGCVLSFGAAGTLVALASARGHGPAGTRANDRWRRLAGPMLTLAVATALLGDPRTVILDEPLNGLDTEGIRWVRGLLRDLAAEGRTVFVSSHLMTEMALTADHVVVIGKGRLIADTSLAGLVADSGHGSLEDAFLDLTADAAEFRTPTAKGDDR